MYRQASLRVPCVACGIEETLVRMALSPRGGHWCWRCQMRAQIAEHDPPRSATAAADAWRRAILIAAAVIVSIIGLYLLLGIAVLAMHPC